MKDNNTEHYPRDLIGYGQTPPNPAWPNKAVIALQIVLNVEEGAENNVLHGDAASEAFLSEIIGAAPWPGQRHMNMESIYEYGSRAGFWRLHRLFTERSIPITVFGVANALARVPDEVAAMNEANWEIATHGLKWIDYRNFSIEEEREHLEQAIQTHKQVTGNLPAGAYIGRTSEHSQDLVAEHNHFEYSADSYADDLPYWRQSPSGAQLMVPYTMDANDMRFSSGQGFNTGREFEHHLTDSFDALYAEGVAGAPKMMSIGLHSRLAGRPGRATAIARFLDHVASHNNVWITRRVDIARHWQQTHPSNA